MSVKGKPEKSKKASDVHSLKHEEKSAQSISSLSSHIGETKREWERLIDEEEIALKAIRHYKQKMDLFIDQTD